MITLNLETEGLKMKHRAEKPQSQAQKIGKFNLSPKYRDPGVSLYYEKPDSKNRFKLLKEWHETAQGLTEAELLVRELGLDGFPIHNDILDLQNVRVAIWNESFWKLERKIQVPFDQATTYEFINLESIPKLRFHTITISIELPIDKYNEWPRDGNGKPLLTCRALGIYSDIPIPPPNFLIISRPDRQPPRADLIYLLKTPVWQSEGARLLPIKFYYLLQKLLCRKLGGAWIGKGGFSYNPYWKEFREESQADRLSIMRLDLWEMKELDRLFGQMPDCNKQGRDEAIVEAIKAGEPYREIAKRFGISYQRVGKIAIENGTSKPTRSFKPDEINAVRNCMARNLTLREITGETGYSIGKVQRIQKFIIK